MNSEAEVQISEALRQFEAVEANLAKLERLCQEIEKLVPNEIQFGSDPDYEDRCRSFRDVLSALPMIDGWKPECSFPDLDYLAQKQLDYEESGEISCVVEANASIEIPGKDLRDYRFRFIKKRRALIQRALSEQINLIDSIICNIKGLLVPNTQMDSSMEGPYWEDLRDHVDQINMLLDSKIKKPPKWHDLKQHLDSGLLSDFRDIERTDWPIVKDGLKECLFGINDPVPVQVDDLSELVPNRTSSIGRSNKNQQELDSPRKKDDESNQPLNIFISYSHKDEDFKDGLITMLTGLKRRGVIDLWQDRRIEEGDEWYQKIQDAIKECDLGILLVSADFIASRFIQDDELPKLLKRRMHDGLRVVPIIIRPCLWQSEPILKDILALPRDGKPVITFSKDNGDRDQVWTDIAKAIENRAK
jgi:hypothetical protein